MRRAIVPRRVRCSGDALGRRKAAGRTARVACGLLAGVFFIVAASAQAAPHATIRWTAHGIPHIEGSDYEGLGYGYGYAFARPKPV